MVELLIHATDLDDETLRQIYNISYNPIFSNSRIAIQADAHAGNTSCIGFTATLDKYINPAIIGVDIGCGVTGCKIGDIEIDFTALDEFLKREIPLGMRHRDIPMKFMHYEQIIVDQAVEVQNRLDIRKHPVEKQIGTLGGGNHFIEIGQGKGHKWIFIHTGSRNFGLQVEKYYERLANAHPCGLKALPMDAEGQDYLRDMQVAQRMAALNRLKILDTILRYLGESEIEVIDSVHNYISEKDGICRKGAISAHKGERLVIPLNMADGVIIGEGNGLENYNFSAPHGAGRVRGRGEMKRMLASGAVTMEDFNERMKGVYTTTATAQTIDESPFAYKTFSMIEKHLQETVTIDEIVRPLYNLKGSE